MHIENKLQRMHIVRAFVCVVFAKIHGQHDEQRSESLRLHRKSSQTLRQRVHIQSAQRVHGDPRRAV